MLKKSLISFLFFLIITIPIISNASDSGMVEGVVMDEDNKPLGAKITVKGFDFIKNYGTIGEGLIMITNLPLQEISITADKNGYYPESKSYKLTEDANHIRVTFVLKKDPFVWSRTGPQNLQLIRDISDSESDFEPSVDVNLTEILTKSNGLVRIYTNRDYTNNNDNYPPEFHLRGGRDYSHDLIVNGMSTRNPLTGTINYRYMLDGINELEINSGMAPLSNGSATSGYIFLNGIDGYDRWSGSLDLNSDNLFGDGYDHNNYSLVLGGPLGTSEKGRVFLGIERVWQRDRTPSPHTEEIYNEKRLPNNSLSSWNYHFKIDYNLTEKLSAALNLDGFDERWQDYLNYFNHPEQPGQIEHTPRSKETQFSSRLNIDYHLDELTYINVYSGYYKNSFIRGDGVLFDDLAAYDRGYTNPEYDIFGLFAEGDSVYVGTDSAQLAPHIYDDYLKHKVEYAEIGGMFERSINRYFSINGGIDFKTFKLKYYNNLTPELGIRDISILNYGYDSEGNENSSDSYVDGLKKPNLLSAFVRGEISLNNTTLVPGLKFESFNNKSYKLVNPERPFDPYEYLTDSDATNDSLGWYLDQGDVERVSAKTRLSPSLDLIINPDDLNKLYFSYRMNYQNVPYRYIYNDWNYFEQRIMAGSFAFLSYGDMDPEKSSSLEIGYEHKFKYAFVSAKVYYVKYYDQITLYHNSPVFPSVYDLYKNTAESSSKGIEISTNGKVNEYLKMFLNGSVSKVSGLSSYPDSYANIVHYSPLGSPTEDFSLDYDLRYAFDCKVLLNTRYFSLLTELDFKSGLPYTMSTFNLPMLPEEPVNNSRMDSRFLINVDLEKKVKVGQFAFTAYMEVLNLFDKKVESYVHPTSGSATSTGYLETDEGILRSNNPYTGDEFVYRYNLIQNNPENFILPRQIFTGIRISF